MSILRSIGFHLSNSGWYDAFVVFLLAISTRMALQAALFPYIFYNIIGFGGFEIFGVAPEDQWLQAGVFAFVITFLYFLSTARDRYSDWLIANYPHYYR